MRDMKGGGKSLVVEIDLVVKLCLEQI
jgi:hypothetical protein